MNRKIVLIIVIIILIITMYKLVNKTVSKLISEDKTNINLLVAKPICRVIMEKNLYISNYEKKKFDFSVCNYNQNDDITDVEMKYYIKISLSQKNAPLKYKMYRIYDDGSEENIELNIRTNYIKSVKPVNFSTKIKQLHNYRLEIEYDNNSNMTIDKNIKINIGVESEQVKIF